MKNTIMLITMLTITSSPALAQELGSDPMTTMEYDQVQHAAGYSMSHSDADNIGGWYVQQQQAQPYNDTTVPPPNGMTQTDYLEMQHQQDLYGRE